jgi:hypothetical protein
MAYKLEYNDPAFPKDTVFDLGGVGVKNGSSVTVDAETQARVEAHHGKPLKEALGNSPFVKISGSKEGGDA